MLIKFKFKRFAGNGPTIIFGKGAVFTNEGKNELDASIMEGKTLKAGAGKGLFIHLFLIPAIQNGLVSSFELSNATFSFLTL